MKFSGLPFLKLHKYKTAKFEFVRMHRTECVIERKQLMGSTHIHIP